MEKEQAGQPPDIMQMACGSWTSTDIFMQNIIFIGGWKSTFAMLQGYVKNRQRRL